MSGYIKFERIAVTVYVVSKAVRRQMRSKPSKTDNNNFLHFKKPTALISQK